MRHIFPINKVIVMDPGLVGRRKYHSYYCRKLKHKYVKEIKIFSIEELPFKF